MKVVINRCAGRFCLSTEAMKRAIAEGASGIAVHDESEYKYHDVGDGYKVGGIIGNVLCKDGVVYVHDDHRAEVRSDPVLVRIVEEMGADASGRLALLKVVEVPDDAEWEILEYGGNEYICEKHRTWS